jgi:hypothetical protein
VGSKDFESWMAAISRRNEALGCGDSATARDEFQKAKKIVDATEKAARQSGRE